MTTNMLHITKKNYYNIRSLLAKNKHKQHFLYLKNTCNVLLIKYKYI
jgi:hypothetical protein